MYRIERDDDGPTQATRHGEDGERPWDGDDAHVWAFATLGTTRDHPIAREDRTFPASDFLFETLEEVVDYCRKRGVMLVVREDARGRVSLDHGCTVNAPQGTGQIHNLLTAVAPGTRNAKKGAVDGIAGLESNLWVSDTLDQALAEALVDEESDLRRLTNWPIKRTFVFIDLSDFSELQAGQQVLMVSELSRAVSLGEFWGEEPAAQRAADDLEATLCIGDGYIYVFKSAVHATYFAAHLASQIEVTVAKGLVPVEVHFRMGIHVGPVYCFWDPGRKDWNYIGEGINGGQRVLSAIGKDKDDVLFISSRVRQELLASCGEDDVSHRILANTQNKGRRLDKHGNPWRVYEINHTNLAPVDVRFLSGDGF